MKKAAIGIDIGGTNLRGGLVGPDLRVENEISLPSPDNFSDLKKAIQKICWDLNSEFNYQLPRGIALPGLIDQKQSRMLISPNINYLNGKELKKIDEKAFFGNDVDMALKGELEKNKDLKKQNVLLINIGTGIGGAIALCGIGSWELNIPIEIGHIVAMPGGRPCNCGNRGCLEAYFSGTAFLKEANRNLSQKIESVEKFFDLAKDGNKQAERILNDGIVALGVSLASMVNIFNLDTVLIGGKIGRSYGLFANKVYLIAKQHLFGRKEFSIEKATLIDKCAIIGAAISALEN